MDLPQNTIIDEWDQVKIPPPPNLSPVEVDSGTTALLVLDIQNQNCNLERRPRCVASLPKIEKLLAEARENGLPVIYSLTSQASPADIKEELAPLAAEPVVKSSVDKFHGSELEGTLKSKGIQTVIIVGTSAHGAVLHTVTGAAMRGFNVIVPIDGMSSDDRYAEQYTTWHLANSPGTRHRITLTKFSMLSF